VLSWSTGCRPNQWWLSHQVIETQPLKQQKVSGKIVRYRIVPAQSRLVGHIFHCGYSLQISCNYYRQYYWIIGYMQIVFYKYPGLLIENINSPVPGPQKNESLPRGITCAFCHWRVFELGPPGGRKTWNLPAVLSYFTSPESCTIPGNIVSPGICNKYFLPLMPFASAHGRYSFISFHYYHIEITLC